MFQHDQNIIKDMMKPIPTNTFLNSIASVFILLSFSSLTFSNGLNWLTYGPISSLTMETYQIDSYMFNLLSVSYMIIYPVGAPLANCTMAIFSSEFGFLFGAFLNCVGALLRCLSYPVRGSIVGYVILLVGQSCCALAQCYIIGMPPLISNRYFHPKLRPFVTSFGVLMNSVGIGFSFMMSPLASTLELGWYQLLFSLIAIFACVSVFISFHSYLNSLAKSFISRLKSSYPKEVEQEEEKEEKYIDIEYDENNLGSHILCDEVSNEKSLFKSNLQRFIDIIKPLGNIHFLLLLLGYGINIGSVWALLSVIDQILEPLNYSTNQVALLGIANIFFGILGTLTSGLLGTLFGNLRTLLKIFYLLEACSVLIFAFSLKKDMFLTILLSQAALGFFSNGVAPLSLELSSELLPNIDEAIPSNHQLVAGNIFSTCVVLILNLALQNKMSFISVLLLSGGCTLISLLMCLYNGPYTRTLEEKKKMHTKIVEMPQTLEMTGYLTL